MNLLKRKLKNNYQLSVNVSALSNSESGRTLILDRDIGDMDALAVKDYYHVVISQGGEYVSSPDFQIVPEQSPYVDNSFKIDAVFTRADVIYVTNIDLIQVMRKLKTKIDVHNLNYAPSSAPPTSSPAEERHTMAGLSADSPGVHLAKIMGLTDIYSTGECEGATTVTYADVQLFVTEKDPLNPFVPKNFITKGRDTILKLRY